MRKITKRFAVIGTTTALALGGGLAWATWTASGSGSSAAQADTALPLTVTSATTDKLFPGGGANVVLHVTNPNAYPVKFSSITKEATTITDAAGCTVANSKVTFDVPPGPASPEDWTIPAGPGGTKDVVLTNAAQMGADAADACQGATFTFGVTLVK